MVTLLIIGVIAIIAYEALAHLIARFLPSDDKEVIQQQREDYLNRKDVIASDLRKAERDAIQSQINTSRHLR